jgi:hypothetical protein
MIASARMGPALELSRLVGVSNGTAIHGTEAG